MTTCVFVPARSLRDWQRLLGKPELHWKSGRSAQCAAQSWMGAGGGLPAEVAAVVGPTPQLLLAIPEHQVEVPGRGGKSQCDVFALIRAGDETIAAAIEAKVTESFGPTVGEWLSKGGNDNSNRTTRLTELCAILGLPSSPPPKLRYQLIHRAAAAAIEAKRFGMSAAAMIVQSFSPEHVGYGDFESFCRMLGLEPERGKAGSVTLPNGQRLMLAWVTSPQPLAEPPAA